jgi:hypothetical protein
MNHRIRGLAVAVSLVVVAVAAVTHASAVHGGNAGNVSAEHVITSPRDPATGIGTGRRR